MRTAKEMSILIKQTLKEKNIPLNKMLSELDINLNLMSSMQNRGCYPRLEPLTNIADYLDLSVDYMLGRTDSNTIVCDSSTNSNNCIIENSDNSIAGNNNVIESKSDSDLSDIEREMISVFRSLDFSEKVDIMKYILDKKV